MVTPCVPVEFARLSPAPYVPLCSPPDVWKSFRSVKPSSASFQEASLNCDFTSVVKAAKRSSLFSEDTKEPDEGIVLFPELDPV